MIKLEDIDEMNDIPSGNCKFLDHIIWLREVFLRARARKIGDFDAVCKLQDDLDKLLIELFDSHD